MKKIITLCLVFYTAGLLAQLAPFSRSKGGSISAPPTPIVEVDPLSVHLTGNENITGTKTFQFGAPVEATTRVNGKNIQLNDLVNSPDITVSVEADKMVITDANSGSSNSLYPWALYLHNGGFDHNIAYNYWLLQDDIGNSIEADPTFIGTYSIAGNSYMTGDALQLNRPLKTSPSNNEALNFQELKKHFVSRSIQDTMTASKVMAAGNFFKVNGTSNTFTTLNGDVVWIENGLTEQRGLLLPGSLRLEDDQTGAALIAFPNRMQIFDRAGYVPGNSDVLRKDETLALLSAVPNTVVFTASGTYTPTPGMRYIEVEMVGGGGGSGSAIALSGTGTSFSCGSAGAGAGGYAKFRMTAAQVGASKAVVIGNGGAAGTNLITPQNGSNGGTTSFGTNTCTGGIGSTSSTADTLIQITGGAGGTCTINSGTEIFKVPGAAGENLFIYYFTRLVGSIIDEPIGGSSFFGQGGTSRKLLTSAGKVIWGFTDPQPAIYGAGAAGWYYLTSSGTGTSGSAGTNGNSGIVIIKEYF